MVHTSVDKTREMNAKPVSRLVIMITFSLFLSHFGAIAQQESLVPTVPPPPNAASLGKFVDHPVSYYTGTPQITIPLPSLPSRSLSVPLSLSYHASGIKVEEIAGWVGLGWNLEGGGAITRTKRGIDDFGNTAAYLGYVNHNESFGDIENDATLLRSVAQGRLDAEPDLFYLKAPGLSVKFIYNKSLSQYVPLEQQDILIEKVGDTWEVTGADGTKYIFGVVNEPDVTYGAIDVNQVTTENINAGDFGAPITEMPFTASWHLAKIISVTHDDEITYEYNTETVRYERIGAENYYVEQADPTLQCSPIQNSLFLVENDVTQAYCKKITSKQGSVEFEASMRIDLLGGHKLDKIIYKNTNGVVRSFSLDYDYFNNTATQAASRRLKLAQVQEEGFDGTVNPPFILSYIGDDAGEPQLPPRYAVSNSDYTQQDHWGYYNANDRPTLVPQETNIGSRIIVYPQGGNRETDAERTKAGVLKQITYPTGGYTQFQYEAHTYSNIAGTVVYEPTPVMETATVSGLNSESELATETITFTVDRSVVARVECQCEQFSTGPDFPEPAVAGATLYRGASPGGQSLISCVDDQDREEYIFLLADTYTIYVEADQVTEGVYGEAEMTVSYETFDPQTSPPDIVLAGGVRIQRMETYEAAGAAPIVRSFDYNTQDDEGRNMSSGVLVTEPTYYYEMTQFERKPSAGESSIGRDPSGNFPDYEVCDFDVITSSSQVPLGLTQGNHLGYKEVTVSYGENGVNGQEIFRYTTADPYSDDGPCRDFPFPPCNSLDAKRGLLEEQITESSEDITVQEVVNQYELNNPSTSHPGLAVRARIGGVSLEGQTFISDYVTSQYNSRSYWVHPLLSRQTIKDQAGATKTLTETTYEYNGNNHSQRTQESVTNSEGQTITTQYRYANDTSETALGSHHLRDNNMLTQVIERSTLIDNEPTQRVATTYDRENGFIVPREVEVYRTGDAGQVTTYYEYDDFGNVIQVTGVDEVPKAFIWGYGNTLPVALIEGATFNEVDNEVNLTSIQTLDGEALQTELNDLRNLSGKLATTYTYEPLTGVTSIRDPAGVPAFYEYDGLKRLFLVRDEDGEIVSRYNYHYSYSGNSQPENGSPTLGTIGDQVNFENNTVSLPVSATDPESDQLIHQATGLPEGLQMNPDTGLISGTIGVDAANDSPYTVEVIVSDINGNSASTSFSWTVNVSTPPIVSSISDQVDDEGDNVSVQVLASDPENDIETYQATNLPPGIQINANSGDIYGTISSGAANSSPYMITVTVTDNQGNSSSVSFTWTVNYANSSPAISITFMNQNGQTIAGDNALTNLSCNLAEVEIIVDATGGVGSYSYNDNLSLPSGVSVSNKNWSGNRLLFRLERFHNNPQDLISFPITVTDGAQNQQTATVTFTVPWNDACP